MNKFRELVSLRHGSSEQQRIFSLLQEIGILQTLADFNPVVAGTFPLDIQVEGSDVDILCEYENPNKFRRFIEDHFKQNNLFAIRDLDHLVPPAIVANFRIHQQKFEVFGQPIPVFEQMGYRHLVIEEKILSKQGDEFKKQIIALKRSGIKTEPAFCTLLGIAGDPYLELLAQGERYAQ